MIKKYSKFIESVDISHSYPEGSTLSLVKIVHEEIQSILYLLTDEGFDCEIMDKKSDWSVDGNNLKHIDKDEYLFSIKVTTPPLPKEIKYNYKSYIKSTDGYKEFIQRFMDILKENGYSQITNLSIINFGDKNKYVMMLHILPT